MPPMAHKGQKGQKGQKPENKEFSEYVVKINRCATVVKGGRRFSFSALVVVGNKKGTVGIGFGKAKEVPLAVQKAMQDARKELNKVFLTGDTIPHEIIGRFGAAKVFMKPAKPGTGVIAGASVRAVVEAAGIKNILTKAFGTTNPVNLTKATLDGLKRLRDKNEVMRLRGVEIK